MADVWRRHMKKNMITLGLVAVVVASAHVAEAQKREVPSIGFLRTSAPPKRYVEALTQGLEKMGYVDGKNIRIEYRDAGGKPEQLPAAAAELVKLKVKAIVIGGTDGVRAAKQATTAIPIVMISADPLADGFVKSLSQPGGNITGFSMMGRELSAKRLQVLKEAFPKVSRVALFWDPYASRPQITLKETVAAALPLGLQIDAFEVRDPEKFAATFAAATQNRAEALVFLPSLIFNTRRSQLVELAAKTRLPAMYEHGTYVRAGGLMSYGPSIPALFRRVAGYVAKILNGAKPGDLPVAQPTAFELMVNLKTAKQLGITVPSSILYRADKVIR